MSTGMGESDVARWLQALLLSDSRRKEAPPERKETVPEKIDEVHELGPINPLFLGIPEITDRFELVTYDFKDGRYLQEPAIALERLPVEAAAQLGRWVIPMLSSGFSPRGAGALFVLAYQLLDPDDGLYVFPEDATPRNAGDITLADLREIIVYAGRAYEQLPATESPALETQVYSYIAASTLRLFAMSESNYAGAFNSIVASYATYYRCRMPVNVPRPTVEALRTLSPCFSNGDIFKYTLYRLLYIGGGLEKKAVGIRSFLYEMRLAHTGMHMVSIFDQLCSVLDCDPKLLVAAICFVKYGGLMKVFLRMVKLSTSPEPEHKRKLWRYGSLFDETFMHQLRTKSCPELVYILASALKYASPNANQNILNIAQLAHIYPTRKRHLGVVGETIVRKIREQLSNHGSSS